MNTKPLTTIAPEIFRKRLIVEGYFGRAIDAETIRAYFETITLGLKLRTYGDPVVHRTAGQGREANEGFDGFVPLIDSGIYISVWAKPKFLSTILYTCGQFDESQAVAIVEEFFQLGEHQAALF